MPNRPHVAVDSDEDKVLMAAVALLYCQYGGKQGPIINALKLVAPMSQSMVSRLIERAKKSGILVTAATVSSDPELQPALEAARQRFLIDEALLKKVTAWAEPKGVAISQVRIFPSRRQEFCSAVAAPVGELFGHSKLGIGVTLGRTIGTVIEKMTRVGADIGRPIKVVPLCGDPIHLINLKHLRQTASTLASELVRRAFGAETTVEQPTMTGVPCYLPTRYQGTGKKHSRVEDYLNEIPGFQNIFGGTRHSANLRERIDTALMGIGIICDNDENDKEELQTGVFIREIIASETSQDAKSILRGLIVGEIGGVLLARPGLKRPELEQLDKYRRGWLGIQEDNLRALAQSAKSRKAPGVILIARGAAKRDAVAAALKNGLVNVLFVDEELGTALKAVE